VEHSHRRETFNFNFFHELTRNPTLYNLLLLPTLLHHELKTRFLHSRIGQFNIQIQCVSSSHAENTVREPNPTQTPQSLRPLSSVTSALPVCLSVCLSVCLFRIRSRLLHGFSANTCSSPQSSPNNYKATKASSANVITAYVSPSPSSPLLSLPTAITNIPLPLQGNYSARVIKRNPWFTFCFIPVIPLSVHGYEDVVCSICNFAQPLPNRQDVIAMKDGGGGGGVPLQHQQQGGGPPAGWGGGPPGGGQGAPKPQQNMQYG